MSVPAPKFLAPVTLEFLHLMDVLGAILVRTLLDLGRPFLCVAAPCLLLDRLPCLNLVLDPFGQAAPVDLLK